MPATFAGLEGLGLVLSPAAITADEFAALRGVDPAKLRLGLGVEEIGACPPEASVADLAVAAARRALADWGGDLSRIGLLAVGSETALDMSRPLSAWVAEALDLRGAIRSYEVKHACYGGTLAIRQAAEWLASGSAPDGAVALVVAADVARYTPESAGEPTMGAGAVALVLGRDGRLATLDRLSHPWSAPAFDFWRPVGRAWPEVDGPLSLQCYQDGAAACYGAAAGDDPAGWLASFRAHVLHVPFAKMAQKGFRHAFAAAGLGDDAITAVLSERVDPWLDWNRRTGNAYTASLWIAFARALGGAAAGERISAFSYGSGYGCELTTWTAGPGAAAAAWPTLIRDDLAGRPLIDGATWQAWRAVETAMVAA